MASIGATLFIVSDRRWIMTYRRYDILTVLVWVILGAALVVLGFFLKRPDFGERVWWVVMGVGIALVVVGVVSIVFSMRQDVELDCPHCGGKVVPRVKSSTSHLYLTTVEGEEEQEEGKAEGDEGGVGSAQEETKGPEQQ
jgi:DNA-directed RNA polymerase subunit RPC12/RpoP